MKKVIKKQTDYCIWFIKKFLKKNEFDKMQYFFTLHVKSFTLYESNAVLLLPPPFSFFYFKYVYYSWCSLQRGRMHSVHFHYFAQYYYIETRRWYLLQYLCSWTKWSNFHYRTFFLFLFILNYSRIKKESK